MPSVAHDPEGEGFNSHFIKVLRHRFRRIIERLQNYTYFVGAASLQMVANQEEENIYHPAMAVSVAVHQAPQRKSLGLASDIR